MSCDILTALGFQAWTPMGYYSQNQSVSVCGVIYISLIHGINTNHSDCPPGHGNPNWAGPFTVEELIRKLQNEKANAL